MKQYELIIDAVNSNSIQVIVDNGSGSITSDLQREVCPACNLPDCNFACDGSQGAYEGDDAEDEEEVLARFQYNSCLDAVESLILAHACAGIDVGSSAYVEGVRTTLEALANDLF